MSLFLVTVEATDMIGDLRAVNPMQVEVIVLAPTERGARKMATSAIKRRGWHDARSVEALPFDPYKTGIIAITRTDLNIALHGKGDLLSPG